MLSGRVVQAYFREVVDHILVHCFADFVCKGGRLQSRVSFAKREGGHEDQF